MGKTTKRLVSKMSRTGKHNFLMALPSKSPIFNNILLLRGNLLLHSEALDVWDTRRFVAQLGIAKWAILLLQCSMPLHAMANCLYKGR